MRTVELQRPVLQEPLAKGQCPTMPRSLIVSSPSTVSRRTTSAQGDGRGALPARLLRIFRGWLCLPVAALAGLSYGAEPANPAVPLHPLVVATEALYQRHLSA